MFLTSNPKVGYYAGKQPRIGQRYYRDMFIGILATCAGIIFVSHLPELLPGVWLAGLAAVTALFLCVAYFSASSSTSSSNLRGNFWSMLAGLLLGVTWGLGYAHYLKSVQLPPDLEGHTFIVTGTIDGLPRNQPVKQRFTFRVEAAVDDKGQGLPVEQFPHQLLLSWFSGPMVSPGERWRLKVKLKRPRGFVNPAGFDYQAWLLRQGLGATGYVRHGEINQRLGNSNGVNIDRLRLRLLRWLSEPDDNNPGGKAADRVANLPVNPPTQNLNGLLIALLIGERSQISTTQWQLLQQTGTNHLIAISGLHIGLVAGIGYWLGKRMGACINLLYPRVTSVVLGSLCSLLLAWFYAALAGFSLPTQRALLMVALVQVALWARRSPVSPHNLALALFLVLLFDPLAGLNLGFWFSFAAVAWLLYGFAGRVKKPVNTGRALSDRSLTAMVLDRSKRKFQWLQEFSNAQIVVTVGLLLPSLLLVNSVSLIAPFANLVAIPLVSVVVVPLLLLAAGLFMILGEASGLVELALQSTQWAISGLWQWLQWLQSTAGGGMWYPDTKLSISVVILGFTGAGVLLMPRGIPGRWLGGLAILVALFPQHPKPSPLTLTALDVGQGLALVVESQGKTLVYDTGPIYSAHFNAGAGIIAPYLKKQGIRQIDALVLSHNDSDHAGGLTGLLTEVPVRRLLVGEPEKSPPQLKAEDCHQAAPWRWQEIEFNVLKMPSAQGHAEPRKSNNRSCVLYIRYGSVQILLPGDIEAESEKALLQAHPALGHIDLLVAPHHGSITSSTRAFVEQIAPQYVVYSAGFNGRYRHPHSEVVARYQARGTRSFNTSREGAIQFRWHSPGDVQITRWRQQAKRYWMSW